MQKNRKEERVCDKGDSSNREFGVEYLLRKEYKDRGVAFVIAQPWR